MTIDTTKADKTLKMQVVRMQLETLAYCLIKMNETSHELVNSFSEFWLSVCRDHHIDPANNFKQEYENFEKETVLKFAPVETLTNMVEKSFLSLEKNGIERDILKKMIHSFET